MRTLSLVILLFAYPLLLFGQDDKARSGSPYSSIASGEPVDTFSPASAGSGIFGIAVFDNFSPNSINPALWGISSYTLGNISLGLQSVHSRDDLDSATFNQMTIDRFQVVLPIVRSTLGVSLGFRPITRSSYSLTGTGTHQSEPGRDPINYINTITGGGGVNSMEAGIGYRFSNNFSVGYAASLYLASLTREHETAFDVLDFGILRYDESMTGRALGHRFGFYGRAGELFNSNDQLAFGATVVLPVDIETDRSVTGFRTVGGRDREVDLMPENSSGNGTIGMPTEVMLGLNYSTGQLWDFSTEFSMQQWENAAYSFNSGHEAYLKNRSRTAAGFRYHPYRTGSDRFFSRLKYSAGVSYDSGHLAIENQNIDTIMFHGGLGLISDRTASSIDLSFQFGFRGTQQQSLVEETIWGFRLSFNLAEVMFVQRRFD